MAALPPFGELRTAWAATAPFASSGWESSPLPPRATSRRLEPVLGEGSL